MFTRSIAVFVAVVVLVTGSPAMAQTSDLLASAERAALTMQVEQDQSVVRRRRSGGLGAVGVVLAGVGTFLALRSPGCELQGGEPTTVERGFSQTRFSYYTSEITYSATRKDGSCGVRVVQTVTYDDSSIQSLSADVHENDANADANRSFFGGRSADTIKTWNYVGWATAAAGGALMWFGLRGVDVPVRFDMAPTGGFRVSRSLGW